MPSGEGMYLPELGKCLIGDTLLLSWGDVLDSIVSTDTSSPLPQATSSFLADHNVKRLLSANIPSFPPPSGQAKSSFETKTAAINIPPSTSQEYDIDQIKADALWLSKEVEIDQVEALRLVVIEWQSRPESSLRSGFSTAELSSLRDALGVEYTGYAGLVNEGVLSRSDTEFDSEDGRRRRLLSLYFHERVRLVAVAKESLERHASEREGLRSQRPASESIQSTISFTQEALQNVTVLKRWSCAEQYHSRINDEYVASNLQSMALAFQLLLIQLKSSGEIQDLLAWLQLMASVDHFKSFNSDISTQQSAILQLQLAAACITVVLLDPVFSISALVDDTSTTTPNLLLDLDAVNEVNDQILNAAGTCNINASLAVLSWGLILVEVRHLATAAKESREAHHVQRGIEGTAHDGAHRRASTGSGASIQQSIFEDIMDRLTTTSPAEDPIGYILDCAVEGCRVFDFVSLLTARVRGHSSLLGTVQLQILQDLLGIALPPLGYVPELVSAQIAILSSTSAAATPSTAFLEDRFLVENLFDVAAARFPYEALPFLRFCKLLAKGKIFDENETQYIAFRLKRLDSFTQAAVRGFSFFTTIREDENANLVSLERSVGMLDFQENKFLTNSNHHSDIVDVISANTIGEVINESTPAVIRWQHHYSGLALIGKWLELHYLGILSAALSPFESPEEIIVEIIGLLTTLLDTTYAQIISSRTDEDARQVCEMILEEANHRLEAGGDVVAYVFELLDQDLQAFRRRTPTGYSCNILVACMEFLVVLSKIRPTQVWSGISKSSILGRPGARGDSLMLITSIEIPNRDFRLLETCANLYEKLVEIALMISLTDSPRPSPPRNPSVRMNGSHLLSYTETMYAAFEAAPVWPFKSSHQKSRINQTLAKSFCNLLQLAYGTGEETGTRGGFTAVYAPAARFLLESLRHSSSADVVLGPITHNLAAHVASHASDDIFGADAAGDIEPQLALANLLIRHRRLAKESPSPFDGQIFSFFPMLIRLSIAYPERSAQCYALARINLQANADADDTSLLGHLGSISSIAFLYHLKNVRNRQNDPNVESQLWKLLSMLVSRSQQWLAIIILTGVAPNSRRSTNQPSQGLARKTLFLETALNALTRIEKLHADVTIGMLEFVVEAQKNWVSVANTINSQHDLFPNLTKWVISQDSYSLDGISRAIHNKVAALVTQLATTHIHHIKEAAVVKTFVPFLNWLTSNAVEVASYNFSLHANLKKNFAMKYNGLDISCIKRTRLVEQPYGEDYFYDIEFANRLLGSDRHWKDKTSPQTFAAEFRRANVNLSLVNSELVLLQNFAHFCVDHCAFLAKDREVQKTMAHVIVNCLRANMQLYPSETLFEALFQTRADLSVALTRQLAAVNSKGSDVTALLSIAWNAARFRNGSYELAIMNDDLVYWRSLLSVILIAMHFHVEKKVKMVTLGAPSGMATQQVDPSNPVFIEIATTVVADGLRSIVKSLHAQSQNPPTGVDGSDVEVRDLSLVLNVLQTMLRLPSLPQFSVQLAESLVSSGVGQSCLLLYSWSHLLTDGNVPQTPLYADLSLQFLVSLSSVPLVAEDLAVEGVLSRILTSRITQQLQTVPKVTSYTDQRPDAALVFSIWARGILPLCANLLHAIGGGITAEVSSFLNQFPAQLSRASLAFAIDPQRRVEGRDVLTLGLATEAATLCLISFILSSFRDAGPSAGVEPTTILPLVGFDEHKKSLAEDIRDVLHQNHADRKRRTVAMNEKEASWHRSNRLDERIVKELRQALACLGQDDEERA